MELTWDLPADHSVVDTDYFRMFVFKIQRDPRDTPHDWVACPFAHPSEKARRRDPTRYRYNGTACADYRKNGSCRRGDACPFAHGVFEAWLHPARYRTKLCTERERCTRPTCFFAHSDAELRQPTSESLEEVRQLRERLLAETRQDARFAQQLDRLAVILEIARTRQQATMLASAAMARATPQDMLRELQGSRGPGSGARRSSASSSRGSGSSSRMREYLMQMAALQQQVAAEQERLAGGGGSSSASLDHGYPNSSWGSAETTQLAARLNSMASCLLLPGQGGEHGSAGAALLPGAEAGEADDWMLTPTARSSRSSLEAGLDLRAMLGLQQQQQQQQQQHQQQQQQGFAFAPPADEWRSSSSGLSGFPSMGQQPYLHSVPEAHPQQHLSLLGLPEVPRAADSSAAFGSVVVSAGSDCGSGGPPARAWTAPPQLPRTRSPGGGQGPAAMESDVQPLADGPRGASLPQPAGAAQQAGGAQPPQRVASADHMLASLPSDLAALM